MRRLALILLISVVGCLGKDQIHGTWKVTFDATAVCNAQEQFIQFQNRSKSAMILEGAAISGGTDPLRNFRLTSIVVGAGEIPSVNGTIDDVVIPSNTTYAFRVKYVPQIVAPSHRAVLDISYRDPAGVVQVELFGSSPRVSDNCPSRGDDDDDPIEEEDILNGEMTVVVEKLVALESINGNTLNSEQGVTEFQETGLSLFLDKDNGTLELRPFTDGSFILPRPGPLAPDVVENNIFSDTIITMANATPGIYDPESGDLTVGNPDEDIQAIVHMEGDITGDLPTILTTGEISLAGSFDKLAAYLGNLENADNLPGHVNIVEKTIFGSPIDPETREIVLVGVTDPVLTKIPLIMQGLDLKLAILIKARIEPVPEEESEATEESPDTPTE